MTSSKAFLDRWLCSTPHVAPNWCLPRHRTGNNPIALRSRKASNIQKSCRAVLMGVSLSIMAGCAGTDFSTIREKNADASANGIRYYELAPFILVYSDGKGGLTSQLIYLADTSQIHVVRPYAVLANNNTTLTFDNGVLNDVKIIADATAIQQAIIDAAKSIALATVAAAGTAVGADKGFAPTPTPPPKGPQTAVYPPPALFRIAVAADGTIKLKGGSGVGPDGRPMEISATLWTPGKASS